MLPSSRRYYDGAMTKGLGQKLRVAVTTEAVAPDAVQHAAEEAGIGLVLTGTEEADVVVGPGPEGRPSVVPSRTPADVAAALAAGAYPAPADSPAAVVAAVARAWRDATERAALLTALARSEEQYQDLVESANDVMLTIDLAGNFTALNAAGEAISGYTREEVRQMNMAQVLTPASLQRAAQMIQQKLQDNTPTTYELEMVARDGHIVPLEVSTRLLIHNGRPVGVHAIARDFTERRRARQELLARTRKQAAVASLGQGALATTDLTQLFDDAVRTVTETLGGPYVTILEMVDEGRHLTACAGRGWHEGVVANERVGAGPGSQAGYALATGEPVVVDHMATETRFAVPAVLQRHAVHSGASVIIHGQPGPFGVLSVFSDEHRPFSEDDIHFLQAVANVVAAAVARRHLEDERAQRDKELAARVLQAQEEERKRIARELHDETAQTLSVLLTNLDLLERDLPRDPTIRRCFDRVTSLARRALDETRALSHDLRPTILDDAGLLAALEWIAAEFERSYGGRAAVEAYFDNDVVLPPEVEVALFRIAQEALTNAGKHALARDVHVRLAVEPAGAVLRVTDNGRGFDPRAVERPTRKGRLGLYGMRERASLVGGTVDIHSGERGTRVEVRVPLAAPVEASA